MRHRKINNLDEKLAAFDHITIHDMKEAKGRYDDIFGRHAPLFVELGAGKGDFITGHAVREPENDFIAIEALDRVILRIGEKVSGLGISNVRMSCCYVEDLREFFDPGSLDGIYINFCDPWPKARHAKRRLVHHNFIEGYMECLRIGGAIEFKTDNAGLFAFALEELRDMGIEPSECTEDLHGSQYAEGKIRTEYEEKFIRQGITIKYLKVEKSADMSTR